MSGVEKEINEILRLLEVFKKSIKLLLNDVAVVDAWMSGLLTGGEFSEADLNVRIVSKSGGVFRTVKKLPIEDLLYKKHPEDAVRDLYYFVIAEVSSKLFNAINQESYENLHTVDGAPGDAEGESKT